MARVADHLSVAESERRSVDCADRVEARHVQVIGLLAQGHTVRATSKVTAFGTHWIVQMLDRHDASGPDVLADVIAAHLGLERVQLRRGWVALQALGYALQRPRPKNPKTATAEETQASRRSWRTPSPECRLPTPACPSRCSAPTSTASA